MILASLFFSMMGALVKLVTVEIPFMEAVFFRSAVMLVLVTPWMVYQKIPFWGVNFIFLALRVVSGFTALSLSFYVVTKISLADASILNRTSIIFLPVLAIIFLNEKVTLSLMIYTISSLIGAVMIIKPSFQIVNVPGLLGLFSGFLASVAYFSIKTLHKTESFFTIVFHFALFGTVASAVLSHDQFILPDAPDWLVLTGIGACGTVAQLLMTYAYKFSDASVVSPYSFASVLYSVFWGMIFWNEIPDLWSVLGTVLIIVCGIGIVRTERSRVAATLD